MRFAGLLGRTANLIGLTVILVYFFQHPITHFQSLVAAIVNRIHKMYTAIKNVRCLLQQLLAEMIESCVAAIHK